MNSKALLKKAIKRTSKNAVIKQLKQFKKTHPQYKKRASQLIRFARFGTVPNWKDSEKTIKILIEFRKFIKAGIANSHLKTTQQFWKTIQKQDKVDVDKVDVEGNYLSLHEFKEVIKSINEKGIGISFNPTDDEQKEAFKLLVRIYNKYGTKKQENLERHDFYQFIDMDNPPLNSPFILEEGIKFIRKDRTWNPEAIELLYKFIKHVQKPEKGLKGLDIDPHDNSISLIEYTNFIRDKVGVTLPPKRDFLYSNSFNLYKKLNPPAHAGSPHVEEVEKFVDFITEEAFLKALVSPPAPPAETTTSTPSAGSPDEPPTPPAETPAKPPAETPTPPPKPPPPPPAETPAEKAVLLSLKGVGNELTKQIAQTIKQAEQILLIGHDEDGGTTTQKQKQDFKISLVEAKKELEELQSAQDQDEKNAVLKFESVNVALRNLKTNIDNLLERIADKTKVHRAKIAEQGKKIAGLEKKIAEQKQQISKEEELKQQITEKMDAANQEKTELQQSLLSAREELSEKEDKLAKIVAEHDSLKKQLESNSLQYKEQLKELQKKYDAILKEKTGLKEKITELESKNTAQKEQILKSEAALRESKETISSQNTAIATLEGQIAGLKQQQEAEQKVVDKKSGKFEEISQKNIHMWNALRMVILMSNLGQRGQEIIQTSKNEIISDTDKKIEEWTKEIDDLSYKIKTNTEQITSFGKLRKKHKNPKKILLKNIELHYKAYRKLW